MMTTVWGVVHGGRIEARLIRRLVRLACQLLLAMVGLGIGSSLPVIWVILNNGSLRAAVWSAPVIFAMIAIAAEWFCSRGHRSWFRPLVWATVAGSLAQLAYLLSISWQVDLTV
jgi:hypothetical protein